jgi:WD40 repeat protein
VIRLWDAAQGTEIAVLYRGGPLRNALISPDGQSVLIAADGTLPRLWNAKRGTEIAALPHPGFILSAAFSPDGTRLVTGSDDNTARLWDIALIAKASGPELRDRVCAERLTGAKRISVADASDPILRDRQDTDVCAPGPLSGAYWFRLARNLFGDRAPPEQHQ